MKNFKFWDEDAPVNATGTAVVGTGDDSSTVIVKKKKDVKVYKRKRKMTNKEIEEARNYRKEYDEYHSKPEQRERNAARLRARRQMEKWGKVKKFDKMDVHHKDNNPLNNGKDNLAVTTQNWNRSEPRLRKEESINILERELSPKELKRREEIAQDLNDADFKKRYGDRWKEVKMGVATNMAKKESIDEADIKDDPKADKLKAKELKVAKAIAQAQLAIAKEQERVQKLTDLQAKLKDQQKPEQKAMKEKYFETKKGSLGEAANKVYEIWNEAQTQGIGEYKQPRQLKDPKKEMMVVKKGVVVVIDKKQWDKMKKMGWAPAESYTPEEENKKESSKVDGRTRSYKETIRRIKMRQERKFKPVTEEEILEVASGDKEAYQKFFQAALKKFGVKSPAQLKGDDEKKFYDYIDKNWKADHEQKEEVQTEGELPPALKKAIAAKKAKSKGKEDDDEEDEQKEGTLPPALKKAIAAKKAEKDGKKNDKEDEDEDKDPVGEKKKLVKEAAIDDLRKIVKSKSIGKVSGVKVDLFSASAMVKVFDALNSTNKAKVEKMLKDKRGVATFQDFAFSQVK